jgi:hypothetical protein
MTSIQQWTVRAPGDPTPRIFESENAAMGAAASMCGASEPAIVRTPRGDQFIVLRASTFIEVSTKHFAGTTRQVVEL